MRKRDNRVVRVYSLVGLCVGVGIAFLNYVLSYVAPETTTVRYTQNVMSIITKPAEWIASHCSQTINIYTFFVTLIVMTILQWIVIGFLTGLCVSEWRYYNEIRDEA